MFEIDPVRLAYAAMVIGIICTFYFSMLHQNDLRETAAEFVIPFVELSNYISPVHLKTHLLIQEAEDGTVIPLPANQQPGEIRALITRANEAYCVKKFAELTAAAYKLEKEAGFNRRHKEQFVGPVNEMLRLTHTFLCGCEDLRTLNTPDKIRDFENYLYRQPQHRYLLMKRLPGRMDAEYRDLNAAYIKEMEKLEKSEKEAMKKRV